MVELGYGCTVDVEIRSSSLFLSHSFSHRFIFLLSASTTSPLAAPAPLGLLLYAARSCIRPMGASHSQESRGTVSLPNSLIPQSTALGAATLEAWKRVTAVSWEGVALRCYHASGALLTQPTENSSIIDALTTSYLPARIKNDVDLSGMVDPPFAAWDDSTRKTPFGERGVTSN